MIIRKIEVNPRFKGKYFVYHIFLHDNKIITEEGKEEIIEKGTVLYNVIDVSEDNILNWDEYSKELKQHWDYWGMPDFPEIGENLSCSNCQYSIWSSHFKYCKQLGRELNNWFRINAQLKDCPFRYLDKERSNL